MSSQILEHLTNRKISYPDKLNMIGLSFVEEYTDPLKPHLLKCNTCEHEWTAIPASKIQNYKKYTQNGCPECNIARKQEQFSLMNDDVITKIQVGYNLLSEYTGRHCQITVSSKTCGHTFTVHAHSLISGNVECSVCSKIKRNNTYAKITKFNSTKIVDGYVGLTDYKAAVAALTKIVVKESKLLKPNHKVIHVISPLQCFMNDVPVEVAADISNILIVRAGYKKPKYIPTKLTPYLGSIANSLTNQFIARVTADMPFFESDKNNILAPYPLTLLSNDGKYGLMFIEFDQYLEQRIKNRNYFDQMQKFAYAKDIRVIFIFQDEFLNDASRVLQKIAHVCKHNNTLEKVYARKCAIKEVPTVDKTLFLNTNHVQGNDRAKITYGAYYNDELVAIMSFAEPRVLMGGKHKAADSWELSRYAANNNYRVIGSASKLLEHFKRNNKWSLIYSYADKRWSDGNLYKQLGFTNTLDNHPDYFYVIDGKRAHRWGFRKHAIAEKYPDIYNPELTEYQNMLNIGIDRVWGVGTLTYELKNV